MSDLAKPPGLLWLPDDIREKFHCYEWRHAAAILRHEFPEEFEDVVEVLRKFHLSSADFLNPGKNKSEMSKRIDEKGFFEQKRKWEKISPLPEGQRL